jgi:uncharacterized surface protein with fasciclin (FAS1) repeats
MKALISAVAAGVIALAGVTQAFAGEAPASQTNNVSNQQATLDIVDTAVAAGSFTTLAAALEAADLVGTLKGEGPFTVFAPTDDAFAALPAGTVEGLLNDIPALTDILLYHVVSGDVRAADVVGLSSATTVGGQDISIEVVGGEVILNGSIKVVTTDIAASNGVIHVIDGVLIPQAATAAPAPPDAGSGNLADDLAGGNALWLALAAAAGGVGLLGAARFATRRARS